MEEIMRNTLAIGILFTALTCVGPAHLSAQDAAPDDWKKVLIQDGDTVYDVVNNVVWLADGNLASKTLPGTIDFQFGLPVCPPLTIKPTEPCVNPSGSMNYTSAVAWIAAMNANNYLGHSDWQLPTKPHKESSCSAHGPRKNSFGFGCDENALGYLYYTALGFKAPNTAVPIPPNTVGPFSNFQPNVYWSGSRGNGPTCNDPIASFSFGSGAQGGGCGGDFAYVLPRIIGDPFAKQTPGTGPLYVNPGGTSVYDPETNSTWVADANLAKRETFGLPRCKTAPDMTACVAHDGSMNYESAKAWIAAMNAYVDPNTGVVGYLGQIIWDFPSLDANCPTYGCKGDSNPMGNLYYKQLKITAGTPVVAFPDIAVGPFHDVVPLPYWECEANTIQEACETDIQPDDPSEISYFGFSFGNGFTGTERVTANHFVTAYFVVTTPTKPPIPPKCPPDDPSCYQ
jgi:hypothetical protein